MHNKINDHFYNYSIENLAKFRLILSQQVMVSILVQTHASLMHNIMWIFWKNSLRETRVKMTFVFQWQNHLHNVNRNVKWRDSLCFFRWLFGLKEQFVTQDSDHIESLPQSVVECCSLNTSMKGKDKQFDCVQI